MGLKVDSSFLKFVTMGAIGTRRVFELMTQAGLQPVELERYSSSNKIWATKVKRLRLPDLLCVRTGLRVEVRAKSKLSIKMSDAPANPDRRWNTGLVAGDMAAFIRVAEGENGVQTAAENCELFWIGDMVATENGSKLGKPKSATEGAEQDREWPSTVAGDSGIVQAVGDGRIATLLDSDRRQTYQLRGKIPYVQQGERFLGETQFLAGLPARKAAFPNPNETRWNPRALLKSEFSVDRYAAVKALGFVGNPSDANAILLIAERDPEKRIALEAAIALARLGNEHGLELLRTAICQPEIDFLRMEALLALSELRATALADQCAEILVECARNPVFLGNEVRQAAIWGLGKDGLRDYNRLLGFIAVPDEGEVVHAILAFGHDADAALASQLVERLTAPASSDRLRASAAYILAKTISPEIGIPQLIAAHVCQDRHSQNWILATLGQMNPAVIRPYVTSKSLEEKLEPLHLTSPETNWTRSEELSEMLAFVRKQTI